MTFTSGRQLRPYTILGPLGAGGMGEVYRARDARLNRDVAIKVLPPIFAADGERLARFEREAKTLASLSHPHIAQIYGIETIGAEGEPRASALVMELVEGDDLSARITQGPLPAADALPIALQIAEALEAAHERGIVHRDLKPANIKVTADGTVKVLDFGLAKAVEEEHVADAANSPTMSMAGTRAGLILGTAGYMAPEQARGHIVDRRADIWAFGVVLFEMLSGTQAFKGETISDVLASVLKHDLHWEALPSNMPVPIVALLRRCLDPNRKTRLRDIGEARVAIAAFLADPPAAEAVSVDGRGVRVWQVAAGVLALALLLISVVAWRSSTSDDGPAMRYVITPPPDVSAYDDLRPSLTVSPSGDAVVFVGRDQTNARLYLRRAGEFDPRPIPGTEGAGNPAFSTDGSRLSFVAGGHLYVSTLEGVSTRVATINDPRGTAWLDAETMVVALSSIGGLSEVPALGGAPRAITTVNEAAGERTHRWPFVLPGGRYVLFTVGAIDSPDDYEDATIEILDRRSGARREVMRGASAAWYAPTGDLIYAKTGSLHAVPFDLSTLTTRGVARVILQGVAGDRTSGAVHVAWNESGTFAYVPADTRGGLREMAWVDRQGLVTPLPLEPALYNDIRLSPDATRVAMVIGGSGSGDVFVYDMARGTSTRLTFDGINGAPIWSRDGEDVFFTSVDAVGRASRVMRARASGGRQPAVIGTTTERVYLKFVSPDATWALVDHLALAGAMRSGIARLSLQGNAAPASVVGTMADEYGAALSPDGTFVAYSSDESGAYEIYVSDMADASGRWQISRGGGEEPMWAADGRALYYRSGPRLMSVPVERAGGFRPGVPRQVLSGIYNLRTDTGISYDFPRAADRFLMLRAAGSAVPSAVRVMTHWFDELRARAQ